MALRINTLLNLKCLHSRLKFPLSQPFYQIPTRNNVTVANSVYLKLSQSDFVVNIQNAMELSQFYLAVPWWANILIITAGLRTLVTLPLAISQQRVLAKYENLMPQFQQLSVALHEEVQRACIVYNWDKKTAKLQYFRSFKKNRRLLIERDNCHPFKAAILVLIQVPMWIGVSFSLRNMVSLLPVENENVHEIYLQLSQGGMLWFPDLTVPDPYCILPVTVGLLNLAVIEMNSLRFKQKKTLFQKVVLNTARGVSIVMVPIAASLPACLPFYWLCSSAYGVLQNIAFLTPKVRRFSKIPLTPTESATPFTDIQTNFLAKFSKSN